MRCRQCGLDKLSREFPPEKLTSACRHPNLHCMRCCLAKIEEKELCPHATCEQAVKKNSQVVELMRHTLGQLFTEYEVPESAQPALASSSLGPVGPVIGKVTVAILTGETVELELRQNMTVAMLKSAIEKELGHHPTKQKLLFNNKELKMYHSAGNVTALSQYGITPGSTIHLMVLLFAIPESFNRVIFALSWGYPTAGKDYLDATCLLFNGPRFLEAHDYRQAQRKSSLRFGEAVVHSGDLMDDRDKTGVHILTVFLQKLPAEVTHIFFTLSAFLAPNIAAFPRKAIHFFDAANPNKSLCNSTFTHATTSQAMVMCYVKRKDKTWEIFQSGERSAGNATYYKPLIETISNFIRRGN